MEFKIEIVMNASFWNFLVPPKLEKAGRHQGSLRCLSAVRKGEECGQRRGERSDKLGSKGEFIVEAFYQRLKLREATNGVILPRSFTSEQKSCIVQWNPPSKQT